jgi:hypothetical protein
MYRGTFFKEISKKKPIHGGKCREWVRPGKEDNLIDGGEYRSTGLEQAQGRGHGGIFGMPERLLQPGPLGQHFYLFGVPGKATVGTAGTADRPLKSPTPRRAYLLVDGYNSRTPGL